MPTTRPVAPAHARQPRKSTSQVTQAMRKRERRVDQQERREALLEPGGGEDEAQHARQDHAGEEADDPGRERTSRRC